MSLYEEIPPVYALNDYVWKLLQVKLGWTTINSRIPIIPAQQQPEFTGENQPFIVYGFAAEGQPSDNYLLNIETVAYTVYGENARQVNQTVGMLSQALRRFDDSAWDLNQWIHSPNNSQRAFFKGMNFGWTEVTASQGAGTQEQEGGRTDSMIVVRYGYTVQIDPFEFKVS